MGCLLRRRRQAASRWEHQALTSRLRSSTSRQLGISRTIVATTIAAARLARRAASSRKISICFWQISAMPSRGVEHIRQILEICEQRVVRYVFMTEAWMVTLPGQGPLPETPPTEHPDRREGDKADRLIIVTFFILRPEHGSPREIGPE
jgi:hypothetical protein